MKPHKRFAVLAGLATLLSAVAVTVTAPAYAAAGCQVNYRKTSSTPVTGNIGIVNTGDPITDGLTLAFT